MVGKLHQHSILFYIMAYIYFLKKETPVIRISKVNKSSNYRVQYFYLYNFYQLPMLPKKYNLVNILNISYQFLHLIHSVIQVINWWQFLCMTSIVISFWQL